jgi:hypothetical protein
MSRETVRLAWSAAWLVSGRLARPGPFKLRAGDGGIILQGLWPMLGVDCGPFRTAGGPGRRLGKVLLETGGLGARPDQASVTPRRDSLGW